MSLRVVTPFVNTNIPNAYPFINVISQPVGLGSSGIVVIMGEADGGNSYQNVPLKNNFFTVDQLQRVAQKYISGQIVDAFAALAAPSNDPDITGSANQVYIIKTNQGTQASSALAGSYGTLSDSNWGVPGNQYQWEILSVDAEVAPTVTGGTIPSFTALNTGMTPAFSIRLNGGASTAVDLPAGTYTTGTQVAAALTGLPGNVTASGNATSITLTVTVDATAWGKGYGKAFELIDTTPGDLAALGLTAGLTVSSQEPEVEVSIINTATNVNQSPEASADIALQIGYEGTTATCTIASGMLTTTTTGGSGANLSINLSQYKTIATLAAFIASQTGYSAVCPSNAQQLPPSALDAVSAIGICSTAADLLPGRIKDAAYNFQQALSTSILKFTPGSAGNAGLPAPTTGYTFLTGGTRGATASNDIVNAIAQLGGIQCNFIIPLFSQDASADIAAGVTDPGSTYTIAAINALLKSHVIGVSTPLYKQNRSAILSYLNTYANCKAEAQSLGNYRCSLTMQSIMQVNSVGNIVTQQPWYAAVLAAGMQAGGFYKSILNKAANIISFVDPSGFDSGNIGDQEDALSSGILFMSQDTGRAGYWVSDQTTYGFDTNFVYNSIQAVYASDLVALDLAQSFFLQFVGQSLADVSAASALSFLTQKMDGYYKLKLIGSSSDAPLGFKNAKVTINAPEMDVAVEIKLATAIYFIPITINVSQIMQSAAQ